jgi:hypothetical protein
MRRNNIMARRILNNLVAAEFAFASVFFISWALVPFGITLFYKEIVGFCGIIAVVCGIGGMAVLTYLYFVGDDFWWNGK